MYFNLGWNLRFTLGPTLMGHQVALYTNYPADASAPFERSKWRQLQWISNSKYQHDDLDKYTEVECSLAGAFGYYYACVTKSVDDTTMRKLLQSNGQRTQIFIDIFYF